MAEPAGERPIVNVLGERVALGPLRRDLVPIYQRWINDLGTQRTLGMPPEPVPLEREQAWFESATREARNTVAFTIYEQATWRPIGNTSLADIDYRHRTATFGILIGEPDARGRGYGTEVTRLMLDFAFTVLGLHNVMLAVFEYNLAGRRAYEKAGFREIGRRRQAHLMGGRLWDVIYMDCLATEFTSPVLSRIFSPDAPKAMAEPPSSESGATRE